MQNWISTKFWVKNPPSFTSIWIVQVQKNDRKWIKIFFAWRDK